MKLILYILLCSYCLNAAEKPNMVFIIADDCTFRDLGTYGGQAKTPNINKLAAQGMKFERCFQAAPMCSPTRHNIYTGLYPVKSGAWPNHTRAYDHVKSIVHHLQPLGYDVYQTGKTHIAPASVFPFKKLGKAKNPDFKNVAANPEYASEIKELKAKLDEWMIDQGDKGIETEMKAKERQSRSGKSKKKKKEKN